MNVKLCVQLSAASFNTMSIDKHIYLGPYLRVDRASFGDIELDELLPDERLTEARDCSVQLSKSFLILLPNCGLSIDRATELSDDDAGVTQMEDVDMEFERSIFYDEYKDSIELIRKEIGDPTKAVVCYGYVIFNY